MVSFFFLCACYDANNVYRDILYELASVGELPLPQPSPTPSNKRDRDSDGPATPSTTASDSPTSPIVDEQRHFAGTKRVFDAHKRQEPFRTTLSSSLTSMNLNGSVDPASSVMEHFYTTSVVGDPGQPQTAMYSAQDSVPSQQYYPQQYMVPGASSFQPGLSPVPPHASQLPGMNSHGGQPLDMAPMFSMQSMMYDQVLSNLSASLMQPSTNSATQQPDSAAEARYSVPREENMEVLMSSLGIDAFAPDMTDNGMLSMWSAAPNGFE